MANRLGRVPGAKMRQPSKDKLWSRLWTAERALEEEKERRQRLEEKLRQLLIDEGVIFKHRRSRTKQ